MRRLRQKIDEAKRGYSSNRYDGDLGELAASRRPVSRWRRSAVAAALVLAASVLVALTVWLIQTDRDPIAQRKDDTPQQQVAAANDDTPSAVSRIEATVKQKPRVRLPLPSSRRDTKFVLMPTESKTKAPRVKVDSTRRKARFAVPSLSFKKTLTQRKSFAAVNKIPPSFTPSLRRSVRSQLKLQLTPLYSKRRENHAA